MSTTTLIPREEVARQFGVSTALLSQYEARGLLRVVSQGNLQGYDPSELRRVWTVLSLQRDAGINLAGVECVLRLRDQFDALHAQMNAVANRLRALIDEEWDDETQTQP